ncbi:MAG: hypothetical protein GC179_01670 [Anaerolineaceae bacterium]|nr:hypothetical protein [Anaerolineaceae bacterium]
MRRLSTRQLWIITLVLLFVAASRAIRINDFHLDNDEIWSIWQTMGTPQQIISWTSPTEHPTYFLLLDAWKQIAGIDPFVLRYLSLLLCLPGVAFMYRALNRQHGFTAGLIAALAYYAFAVSQFTSLQTRSYVFAQIALPLFLWFSLRYFDHPNWKRAILLAFSLFLLYVGTITIVPALALMGLYLLIMYRWRIWTGIFPAIVALILIAPDFIYNKLLRVQEHSSVSRMYKLPPLPQAWFDFFSYFTSVPPLWYLLVVIALGTIIFAYRHQSRLLDNRHIHFSTQSLDLVFWLGWLILVPLLLYMFDAQLGFFVPTRYGWWYVFGVAIFLGIALARLPNTGRFIVALAFIALAFFPFRLNNFGFIVTPLGENLKWLREHMDANDALMLDPNISCNFPEEWDYYTRLYFPDGLRYVDHPEGTQRLWYVEPRDEASQQVEKELTQTRVPGRFVGPPGCFFRLYEAPPDPVGVLYPNGMRFHGAEIMDGDRPLNGIPVMREGQPFKVRVWWSVDKQVPLDYSVSLSLSRVVIESNWDSAPNIVFPEGAPHETSRWQPGQIYVEERDLQIPYPYSRGGLALNLVVYWFGDNQRLITDGVAADGNRFLKRIEVVAW